MADRCRRRVDFGWGRLFVRVRLGLGVLVAAGAVVGALAVAHSAQAAPQPTAPSASPASPAAAPTATVRGRAVVGGRDRLLGTPPGPPTSPTATPGANQVKISWTAPTSTGTGIANYLVTASPGGQTCSTSFTNCTVTGLTGGTLYTFSVVAVGLAGSGSSTAATIAVTPGPPGPPTAVTAVAGVTAATVSWTAPANPGGGIASYTVTSSPGGFTCTTTGTSCTVTGLTNGTAYTFTVVANGLTNGTPYTFTVAATGPGGTSAAATSAPVAPGPPDKPTAVTGTITAGQATIGWTPPTNAGNGIDSYTVTAAPGAGTCTTTGTTCTIGGLSGLYTYTFTVIATGTPGTGNSPPSDPLTLVPPGSAGTVPPTAVTARPGVGGAVVSWSASRPGANVSSYTVTAIPGGATCRTTTTSCTVTGLAPGATYTFTVVAATSSGPVAAGSPSNRINTGPPGRPTTVTATGTGTSATVSWAPPGNTGAGIDHYTVRASAGGATCTTTGTTCTVTGLSAGTPYTFTVVAAGAAATGNSAPSVPSATVTPARPGTPGGTTPSQPVTPGRLGSPVGVTASAGPQSVTVSWKPPTMVHAHITGYLVTTSPGGSTCTTLALLCTITGLTPGRAYTFTVVAIGPAGAGTLATTSPITPRQPTAPSGGHVPPWTLPQPMSRTVVVTTVLPTGDRPA